MGYEHRLWRLLLGVFAALTGVTGSGVGQLAVAAAVVAGSGQEPLGCWICTSQSHGPECYHPLNQTSSFTAAATNNCTHDQLFCMVKRTWYVVEGEEEEIESSLNRTCARECSPYCMVIGDRTKIFSCVSCCTESFCNTGSSASSRPQAIAARIFCPALLLATLMPMLMAPVWPHSL